MKSEKENCGFEELMVAYIYDEATSAERHRFEGHLLDCSPCTVEFASLSNARLSVFEWQKEDFADLATPHFDIPYERAKAVEDEIGWFAKLRGAFSGFGFPVATAAGVLIVLGIGFAAVSIFNQPNQQIAANLDVNRPVVEQRSPSLPNVVVDPIPPVTTAASTENPPSIDREIAPVRAVEVRRSKPSRPTATQTAERRVNSNRLKKAPALNDFEEDDDRSLRLTDLFEGEIGGVN